VSDHFEPDPAPEVHGEDPIDADEQTVDALPVFSGPPRIVPAGARGGRLSGTHRPPLAMMPAVQAAAVAAGGFVAGAAVLGLVHRHQRSTALAQGRRAGRDLSRRHGRKDARLPAGEILQVVGSRSLLVDVHLLGGASSDR
jgi:hypothetical protein